MKVMIIPGNAGPNISNHWYPYVKRELEKLGFTVIAENMPDPVLARANYWVPFIEQKVAGDEDIILIGHSSGTVASFKYAEKHKIKGMVIVGAYHTDLGLDDEKQSGYFDKPFEWEKIKNNSQWIIQFAAVDDSVIPISEARYVAKKLSSEYHEYPDKGHYLHEETPEIIEEIKKKLSV